MSEYKEKKWLEDLKEGKVARDSFPEKFSFKSDPHFRFYKLKIICGMLCEETLGKS